MLQLKLIKKIKRILTVHKASRRTAALGQNKAASKPLSYSWRWLKCPSSQWGKCDRSQLLAQCAVICHRDFLDHRWYLTVFSEVVLYTLKTSDRHLLHWWKFNTNILLQGLPHTKLPTFEELFPFVYSETACKFPVLEETVKNYFLFTLFVSLTIL